MTESAKLRVLLVGEESAAVQTLRSILLPNPEYTVVAVMTSVDEAVSRNTSLMSVAQGFGLPVWSAPLVRDPEFAAKIAAERVDVMLNVHSRYIVNERVLHAPRIGAFNMHPGPLPEFAGLNCVSWALYRGEPTYGVTVHWMTREIDAGDIAYPVMFPIEKDDTPLLLTHKCVKAGVPMLARLLETAASNPSAIPRIRQDLSRREYFSKEIPGDGRLVWNRSADKIVNFVRACDYTPFPSPWGLPTASWEDREIAIVKADRTYQKCEGPPGAIGVCDRTGALVASADEWISVRELKIDGRHVRPETILRTGSLLHDGA